MHSQEQEFQPPPMQVFHPRPRQRPSPPDMRAQPPPIQSFNPEPPHQPLQGENFQPAPMKKMRPQPPQQPPQIPSESPQEEFQPTQNLVEPVQLPEQPTQSREEEFRPPAMRKFRPEPPRQVPVEAIQPAQLPRELSQVPRKVMQPPQPESRVPQESIQEPKNPLQPPSKPPQMPTSVFQASQPERQPPSQEGQPPQIPVEPIPVRSQPPPTVPETPVTPVSPAFKQPQPPAEEFSPPQMAVETPELPIEMPVEEFQPPQIQVEPPQISRNKFRPPQIPMVSAPQPPEQPPQVPVQPVQAVRIPQKPPQVQITMVPERPETPEIPSTRPQIQPESPVAIEVPIQPPTEMAPVQPEPIEITGQSTSEPASTKPESPAATEVPLQPSPPPREPSPPPQTTFELQSTTTRRPGQALQWLAIAALARALPAPPVEKEEKHAQQTIDFLRFQQQMNRGPVEQQPLPVPSPARAHSRPTAEEGMPQKPSVQVRKMSPMEIIQRVDQLPKTNHMVNELPDINHMVDQLPQIVQVEPAKTRGTEKLESISERNLLEVKTKEEILEKTVDKEDAKAYAPRLNINKPLQRIRIMPITAETTSTMPEIPITASTTTESSLTPVSTTIYSEAVTNKKIHSGTVSFSATEEIAMTSTTEGSIPTSNGVIYLANTASSVPLVNKQIYTEPSSSIPPASSTFYSSEIVRSDISATTDTPVVRLPEMISPMLIDHSSVKMKTISKPGEEVVLVDHRNRVVDQGIEELESRTQFWPRKNRLLSTSTGTTQAPQTSAQTDASTTTQTLAPSTEAPRPSSVRTQQPPLPATNEVDDTCMQPPDAGPCTEYIPRWYFNSQTAKCEQFSYGSCQGNKNNFLEKLHCEIKCHERLSAFVDKLPVRCTWPREEGFGGGYAVKWYYNQRNLRCEQMVYQGQGGNDNQFSNLGDCERSCTLTSSIGFTPPPIFVPPPVVTTTSKPKVHEGKVEVIDKKIPNRVDASNTAVSQSEDGAVGAPAPSQPIPPTNPRYGAEPFSKDPPPKNLPPMIGGSPPATIDYANNKRLEPGNTINKLAGITTHVTIRESSSDSSNDKKIDFGTQVDAATTNGDELVGTTDAVNGVQKEEVQKIPICPNGLNAMQYADGRPVMCLPGKNQCPDKSVCYFNGLDFFCCPNEDDPYDQHIFGGYDGEEVKHGYKNVPTNLNIRSIRRSKRAPVIAPALARGMNRPMPSSSFSIDHVTSPLRFDDKPIHSISSAGLASRRVNPCIEEVDRGQCNEAHLRYFYDINNDHCRLFYYSGCNGNSNNFATLPECEQRCKIGIIVTVTRTTPASIESTSAATPPGRCPNGQMPLGDTSPVLCGNRTDSIGCPNGYYCRTGPPDVCCPEVESGIDLGKILAEQRERGDVRRKPFISSADNSEHHHQHDDKAHDEHHSHAHGVATQQTKQGAYDEASTTNAATESQPAEVSADVSGSTSSSNLQTPSSMCPDGSDALLDAAGKPVSCGAGFDGHDLCPKSYYCSIDMDRNGRLCCPMVVQGSSVPSGGIPPYFGVRNSNPGEVIERGSLPSDPKPPKLVTPAPKMSKMQQAMMVAEPASVVDYSDEQSIATPPVTNTEQPSAAAPSTGAQQQLPVAEVSAAAMPDGGQEKHPAVVYDALLLKRPNTNRKVENSLQDAKLDVERHDGRDFEEGARNEEDPFDTQMRQWKAKPSKDKSVCFLRPNEGRPCREDEPSPLSNLQFFYSGKDRLCKVFFYRGCSGNANRFESKRECEQYCANKA
uniref:BPTI/Kunitz inhibitor domain-containing protein n=1 Tax=Ditylenchus dipsaci TaxID=166011 RepID=A0A915E9P5_9BILA